MIALARMIALRFAVLVVASIACPATSAAADPAGAEVALRGACYCRSAGTLHCTASLTELECRRQCDDALCDDWFWKDRLPCWNWGYGG